MTKKVGSVVYRIYTIRGTCFSLSWSIVQIIRDDSPSSVGLSDVGPGRYPDFRPENRRRNAAADYRSLSPTTAISQKLTEIEQQYPDTGIWVMWKTIKNG